MELDVEIIKRRSLSHLIPLRFHQYVLFGRGRHGMEIIYYQDGCLVVVDRELLGHKPFSSPRPLIYCGRHGEAGVLFPARFGSEPESIHGLASLDWDHEHQPL